MEEEAGEQVNCHHHDEDIITNRLTDIGITAIRDTMAHMPPALLLYIQYSCGTTVLVDLERSIMKLNTLILQRNHIKWKSVDSVGSFGLYFAASNLSPPSCQVRAILPPHNNLQIP